MVVNRARRLNADSRADRQRQDAGGVSLVPRSAHVRAAAAGEPAMPRGHGSFGPATTRQTWRYPRPVQNRPGNGHHRLPPISRGVVLLAAARRPWAGDIQPRPSTRDVTAAPAMTDATTYRLDTWDSGRRQRYKHGLDLGSHFADVVCAPYAESGHAAELRVHRGHD